MILRARSLLACDLESTVAGFPKPHAYWYVAKWLHAHATATPIAPSVPNVHAPPFVRILDLLDHLRPVGNGGAGTCTISAIATTPAVVLLADSVALGEPVPLPNATQDDGVDTASAQWQVPCVPEASRARAPSEAAGGDDAASPPRWRLAAGTRLEARGLSTSGEVVATHTLVAPAAVIRQIQLALDVPSPRSGTGERLLLDGRDTALVSAALCDASDALVTSVSPTVSFRVIRGPGRIVGVGNGDPSNHQPPSSSFVAAYGGLARVLVQASVDCASANRELIRWTDFDGARRTEVVTDDLRAAAVATEDIVVEARVGGDGLEAAITATVAIPLSCDASTDSALAVAQRQALRAEPLDFSYLRAFQG